MILSDRWGRKRIVFALTGLTIAGGCEQKAGAPNYLVSCRPSGASDYQRSCAVERSDSPDGSILTLRHPDGRFRRLLVTTDGHGVIAADGAEPAEVRMSGKGEIEVTISGDSYRLPAKAKSAS